MEALSGRDAASVSAGGAVSAACPAQPGHPSSAVRRRAPGARRREPGKSAPWSLRGQTDAACACSAAATA